MTSGEFYTRQFYDWEYRCRGWHLMDQPVFLEPPFMPFYRHGFPATRYDDGKRHTFFSKLLASSNTTSETDDTLNYTSLEVFPHPLDESLECAHIVFPKNRKFYTDILRSVFVLASTMPTRLTFEIIAEADSIRFQFVASPDSLAYLELFWASHIPDVKLVRDTHDLNLYDNDLSAYVVDFGLQQEVIRPIRTYKSGEEPLLGIFSLLETVDIAERVVIQILFEPAVNRWSESFIRSATLQNGSSFFGDAHDAPELARAKVQSPLYGVCIRLLTQAATIEDVGLLLERLSRLICLMSSGQHNALVPLSDDAYDFETRRLDMQCRQSYRLGMLLNLDELLTFVRLPSQLILSKKLLSSSGKTKEVPVCARDKHYLVGMNEHEGMIQDVTCSLEDRYKHMHLIGATGTGKSTLIVQLVLQDIQANNAVVVFDPHGDMIDDIAARIPDHRKQDVIIIDPADTEYCVPFNILEANTDIEREVLASDIVSIFRRFATSWGDQMNSILANAVLAILESKQGGTIHELRRFILEKPFRQTMLDSISDPATKYYWEYEYPLMKTTSIGPILTRLDTFLRSKTIRRMLTSPGGLDFSQLINNGKILLCRLSQGLIGKENSYLLGSLLVSKIHQSILSRQQSQHRAPVFIYLDEFQNFITPSLTEMLSGVRKYNAGLIVAHQDLHQLNRDTELQHSILANANLRVVFRINDIDAKKLADGYRGFDPIDFQNLSKGEAVFRIEQPDFDCSVTTIPLDTINDKDIRVNQVFTSSRINYAVKHADHVQQTQFASGNATAPEQLRTENTPLKKSDVSHKAVARPKPQVQIQNAENTNEQEYQSTHRYLQLLIKKVAESHGFIATLEAALPDNAGRVDIVLKKDAIELAIEISDSTSPEWEIHNIEKCIQAGYTNIISIAGDIKKLESIKKLWQQKSQASNAEVSFYTPDALFAYLDSLVIQSQEPVAQTMKGYRINVSYNSPDAKADAQKRRAITKIIGESLRKNKK